jgi:hypothetical protein
MYIHKMHGEGVVIVLGPSGKLLFAFAGHSMLMHLSLLHPAVLRCACFSQSCELSMARSALAECGRIVSCSASQILSLHWHVRCTTKPVRRPCLLHSILVTQNAYAMASNVASAL